MDDEELFFDEKIFGTCLRGSGVELGMEDDSDRVKFDEESE